MGCMNGENNKLSLAEEKRRDIFEVIEKIKDEETLSFIYKIVIRLMD